jgi:DnaA family protein
MRLNWGAIVQLQTMVDTESIDALIFKAETMGFEITPQIGRFLILDQKVKIDELWELLQKLDHASLSAKRKLTLPFLKELFKDQNLKTQHN